MKLKTIVKGTGDNKYTSNKISSQNLLQNLRGYVIL